IVRLHQGRFKTEDIAPGSSRVLEERFVKDEHVRAVNDAALLRQPAGQLRIVLGEVFIGEVGGVAAVDVRGRSEEKAQRQSRTDAQTPQRVKGDTKPIAS